MENPPKGLDQENLLCSKDCVFMYLTFPIINTSCKGGNCHDGSLKGKATTSLFI